MNWVAVIALSAALAATVWFTVDAWLKGSPLSIAVAGACIVLLLLALIWEAVQE